MITLGLDEARRSERRSLDYGSFATMGLLGPPTTSGVAVSQASANTVSAYWNGICVIASDIGVIGPPDLYKRVGEDDREKVSNDPVARVLSDPSPNTTPMQFWQTITAHAVSWGNGYAEIEYDRAMRPIGLHIIMPDQIEPKCETVNGYSVVYYENKGPGQKRLESSEVFHLPGMGYDGIRGWSPVALARQSLGLSIAAIQYLGSMFGNGAWPGIAIEHEGKISPEALERLKVALSREHQGSEKAHKVLVLDQGLKVSKPITFPPEDLQTIELLGFQIEEMARHLNIAPHKLKHKMGERPGGNFEASELDYSVTTLLPWARRITDECDRKLIAPARRGRFYTELNFGKRLMTDTNTRMISYRALYDMKVITSAQIARKENLPKPEVQDDPEPVPAPPAKEPQMKGRVVAAQQRALGAVLQRYLRREVENMRRAAKKGPGAFGDRVEEFYSEGEAAVLAESLEPAVDAAIAALGLDGDARAVAVGFAVGYLERSKGELLGLKANEIESAVPATLKRWEGLRAAEGVEELMAAIAAEEREHVA